MKYLFNKKTIQKKYEDEIATILEGSKYRIDKIESFAPFPDQLHPFCECSTLLNVKYLPISFSECESRCKLLGADGLSYHKKVYDTAKYNWAKKNCIEAKIEKEENLSLIQEIQKSTLPFGSFSIAFKCHRLTDETVKSKYSNQDIPYAPFLYEFVDVYGGASDFFCRILADMLNGEEEKFCQMNIYTDNILNKSDVDSIYPLVQEVAQKYNEYATELYNAFKEDALYLHRDDFPK